MSEKGTVGVEGVEEMRVCLGGSEAVGCGPLCCCFVQGDGCGEAERNTILFVEGISETRGDALCDGHAGEGSSRDPLDLDALSQFFFGLSLEVGEEAVLEDGFKVLLGVSAVQDFQGVQVYGRVMFTML